MAAKTDAHDRAPESKPRQLRPATRVFMLLLPAMFALVALYLAAHPLRYDELQPRPLNYRVNVNQADAETLQLLPRVGPTLAENMIEHRESHGPFREPADLDAVPRIGPKTLAELEPWVSFDATAPAESLP